MAIDPERPAAVVSWINVLAILLLFQLTASEADLLQRLDVGRVETMTRHLSEAIAQSPSGAGFGSAIAGSPEERALADVIALELERLGLDPMPPSTSNRLQQLETEALAGCREALFVLTCKLEKAVAILEGESVLGAPPFARAR